MFFKPSAKYKYFLVFIIFFIFFIATVNKQKLDFYNLQNAIVESLIEQRSLGIKGTGTSNWTFYNQQTNTPQLQYIGDVFYYDGLYYPAKSYGAHYWAAVVYSILNFFGLSFHSNYYLVSFILLSMSSILLACIGLTLTYIVSKNLTKNNIKAVFVTTCLALGSLLTGGINVRNEESFGYWLILIVYLLTFFNVKNRFFLFLTVLLTYYAVFSLPIATILLPYLLYRIYRSIGYKFKLDYVLINILSISLIFLHNSFVFDRLIYSPYELASKVNLGYKNAFLNLSVINFLDKLKFYFLDYKTSLFINYPLIVLAIVGIVISRLAKFEKVILFLTLIVFIFYITNIKDIGWVGYGTGRYALGLFPLTYLYLSFILKKFNPFFLVSIFIASIISIYRGLFFLFSPVRNVYDQSNDQFVNLLFQGNFFLLIAIVLVLIILISLQFKKSFI